MKEDAYSRWVLIKFSPFSVSVVCLFCNGEVSYYYLFNFNFNLIVTQVGVVGVFTYLSLIKRGGGGRLFEAGHLFENIL